MRHLGTESIIVAESLELIDFGKIVSLNSSAEYVWKSLSDDNFDIDTIAHLLIERYDVDESTAHTDARELTDVWLEAGIIDNENCQ